MPITVNLEIMLLASIFKMSEHFGKKIAKIFFKLKKSQNSRINHVNNLFIHKSKMEQNVFPNIRLNTSQFIFLAKEADS